MTLGQMVARLRVAAIAMCLVISVAGCEAAARRTADADALALPHSPGALMVRTELFFGLGRAYGSEVSDEQWQAFVGEELAPRFPDGFTVLIARGQWRDAQGIVHQEPARVVIVIHENPGPVGARIEQVRELYKHRFGQESVLRCDVAARVSF